MRRRLFNLAAAVSLVLLLVSLLFWVERVPFLYDPTYSPIPYFGGGRVQWTETRLPSIVPVIATALIPAIWFKRWLIAWLRHERTGHCEHCGYDLRATPERCPECGTAVGGERVRPA